MSDHPAQTHDQDVGARLRTVRLRYRLKQEELAAALGVKHAAISRWEQGTRGLTVDMLLTIAERLGIPASSLLPERHQAPAATVPTPPLTEHRSSQDAAIQSIIHVLRERPDLIFGVMEWIEQQADEAPGAAEGDLQR